MGTLNNYDYAYKEMPSFGFPRYAYAAILCDPNDKSHDFAEIVALNAGFNVKVFHDMELAIAWLKSS